jgi:hypothetical protein
MPKDPIVEEIRAIRDELAALHGYDLDAILQALRKASEDCARHVVSLPPRPAMSDLGARQAG